VARKPRVLEANIERDLLSILRIASRSFTRPWSPALFADALTPTIGALCYVARSDADEVVGYAIGQLVVDETHIHGVAVDVDWRGEGVGHALVSRLLTHAAQQGATTATLEVRESNIAAQRLYDRVGFTRCATRPGYYTDPTEAAIIYWLSSLTPQP